MDKFSWEDVALKRTHPPTPYTKRILVQEIPDDKVYGRGAFDENLKNLNRVNEWSYIQKPNAVRASTDTGRSSGQGSISSGLGPNGSRRPTKGSAGN